MAVPTFHRQPHGAVHVRWCAVFSERQAVRIPKDVPFTSAALVGCGVITGVGAVWNRTDVQPGDTAAVFGTGGVGLNVIQALRLKRAGRIIAIDTNAGKEELARQFGATDFIDASSCTDVPCALSCRTHSGSLQRCSTLVASTGVSTWSRILR
jgi:Zn-dependent alcohol dehydrogenase